MTSVSTFLKFFLCTKFYKSYNAQWGTILLKVLTRNPSHISYGTKHTIITIGLASMNLVWESTLGLWTMSPVRWQPLMVVLSVNFKGTKLLQTFYLY